MQANFEAALAEKGALAASTALTQDRMLAAEKLLAALAGEASRWKSEAGGIRRDYRKTGRYTSYIIEWAFQLLEDFHRVKCAAVGKLHR